jgi:hypothetical protein
MRAIQGVSCQSLGGILILFAAQWRMQELPLSSLSSDMTKKSKKES